MAKGLMQDKDYRLNTLMILTMNAIGKSEEKEMQKIWDLDGRSRGVIYCGSGGEHVTPAEISRWLLREHHFFYDR